MNFLRQFADELARCASRDEVAHALRLFRAARLLTGPSGPSHHQDASEAFNDATASADPTDDVTRVGIWERKEGDRNPGFVRSLRRLPEWYRWANVGHIEPKGSKRRVVLLGESVARGYFYDPLFTPAMALSRILESFFGTGQIEVIDLACTDMGTEIEQVAREAYQLGPDALVIFAGNNWARTSVAEPSALAALQSGGIAGLKRALEEQVSESSMGVIRRLNAFCRDRGVPLVWLVPEFNLLDWREPASGPPHLASGANAEWARLSTALDVATRNHDHEVAERHARRMHELDGGVCPLPLYALAECNLAKGDAAAARRYLELARDSQFWDRWRHVSPRPLAIVQDAMRSAAQDRVFVVDLPDVFQTEMTTALPARRLFLDYCHLTVEGIQRAMAAAAETVILALGKRPPARTDLRQRSPSPPAMVEADAAFLAAIHNAHWYQSRDVVRYYCAQALKLDPHLAAVMSVYLDLQTRRSPMLMCRAAEQIVGSASAQIQQYLLRQNTKRLDTVLLDVLTAVLEDAGVPSKTRLSKLRREEHSVCTRDCNLLEFYYGTAAGQPREVMWATDVGNRRRVGPDYYRAYSHTSRFVFVAEATCGVELRLCCRLPKLGTRAGRVSVVMNATDQTDLKADQCWRHWVLDYPAASIRDGVNELVLAWPECEFPEQKGVALAASQILQDQLPEFYPVYGEVHSLTASARGGSRAERSERIPTRQQAGGDRRGPGHAADGGGRGEPSSPQGV
jgi:hypothetical protein